MKKLILVSSLWVVVCGWVNAQWVSIPDTNFGMWLNSNGYNQCLQGNSLLGWGLDTTCNKILNDTVVDCGNKQIKSLEGIQYFKGLKVLAFNENPVATFPALPSTLTHLYCTSIGATALSTLPTGLTRLDCWNNQLTSLPPLPDSLKFLNCGINPLGQLPQLPLGLRGLACHTCNLDSLQSLPPQLYELSCQNNFLTKLPPLPATLKFLDCAGNQLTLLPALPQLQGLNCSNNFLAALPALPLTTYLSLNCSENYLTTLPDLPYSMLSLNVSGNPISCLPPLGYIHTFNFTSTAITCLPSYQSIAASNPAIAGFPQCSSINPNPCPFCYAYFYVEPDTANQGIYFGYNLSTGTNITGYLWNFGDGATSTDPYPTHVYAQPGTYNVCLTITGTTCSDTYCDSSFYVFKTEGGLMSKFQVLSPNGLTQETAADKFSFSLTPNPASTQLIIGISEQHSSSTLTLTDLAGRVVLKSEITNPKSEISIAELPGGIYLATLTTPNGQRAVRKVVKE